MKSYKLAVWLLLLQGLISSCYGKGYRDLSEVEQLRLQAEADSFVIQMENNPGMYKPVVKGYYPKWKMKMFLYEGFGKEGVWVEKMMVDNVLVTEVYPLSEVRDSANPNLKGASFSEHKGQAKLAKLHAIERYMIQVYDKKEGN